mmetsp:Transcript_31440/g.34821  ORF Transcript_31440/g.34821 Transcript_31440/m.34821 type:complete len:1416 (+) Transcript_31440:200-4447(+)|eukprot:CAMPEP_0194153038 /NCGR_PEP_ID=MMETSP0152-20130528/55030_1 /TAXON_ID=1049557 /ORGANISM="Thalassiothrix antarctica, Strain L6-D1" /LENGTH=1415 /DNA_ID=CAMNT_0038858073 /DNA_START=200 /DNA_END=4447 /DNA_ORIENTATION=-
MNRKPGANARRGAENHDDRRRINTETKDNSLCDSNHLSDDALQLQTPAKTEGKQKTDRRKLIDATTPTLEDEDQDQCSGRSDSEDDQEEEEMVSLEKQRLQRARVSSLSVTTKEHDKFREERSLRRTPGASQMHHSSPQLKRSTGELLGFGLALTTPIAGGKKDQNISVVPRQSPTTKPPLDPSSRQREDASYTPASFALTKNPHLQVNSGAFSPNTLRLTEDLDNLLDDGEDNQVEEGTEDLATPELDNESWTASYIFESEGGHAEMSCVLGKIRNRRGGGGGGTVTGNGYVNRRKGNNSDSPREGHPQKFLFDDQHTPKPMKSVGSEAFSEGEGIDKISQPLTFGGAFAPPNKNHMGTNLQRPVAANACNTHTGGNSFESHVSLMQHHRHQDMFHAQQQQVFNPSVFGHYQVPHDPQQAYVPVSMYNNHQHLGLQRPMQPAAVGMQQQPTSYDQPTLNMGSSFVQQGYAPPMQQQSWSHMMMPIPVPLQNHYENCMDQQHTWSNSMMERPWATNNIGQNIPSVALTGRISLTPSPQLQQMQPIYHQQHWKSQESSTQYGVQLEKNDVFQREQPYDYITQQNENTKSVRRVNTDTTKSGGNRKEIRQKKNDKKQSRSSRNKNEKGRRKQTTRTSPLAHKGSGTSKCGTSKGRKPGQVDNVSDIKRSDLSESPETRAAFKEFYRKFRLKEKTSFNEAESFALNALDDKNIPSRMHWKIYLELADLAKRSNRFEEARRRYLKVCKIQPQASQGWLEFSKLEEECGRMKRCAEILREGLKHCELSENLLARAIKHEEKTSNINRAREFLARLKHVGIDKVWRTVLEGALLESRAGNHLMARRVLKYLMHHVPWYGPLYLEAYKLERDLGRLKEALVIVEKGVKAIPKYGPLWFGAFRLCEILDRSENAFCLPRTTRMFERAISNISHELIWKVHLEASQTLERGALATVEKHSNINIHDALNAGRKRLAMTALRCPANLSWRVWLAGGRMELTAGNIDIARKLFLRALKVVPEKAKMSTLLECARLEEFAGDIDLARCILIKSRQAPNTDWKVWLESVQLEIRQGAYQASLLLAKQAVRKYPGTGRLWACLVQLRFIEGAEDAQHLSLKHALRSVPKSGEVWCEGGRIHLNPLSKLFNLHEARCHLQFATRFTPQYGDGFLETLRLEIIERWILPMASCIWEVLQSSLLKNLEDTSASVSSLVVAGVKLLLTASNGGSSGEFRDDIFDKSVLPSLRAQLETTNLDKLLENSDLELRCANADPNYGSMWFNCRSAPTDTARVVLKLARERIVADVKEQVHIYIAAILRLYGLMAAAKLKIHFNDDDIEMESDSALKIDKVLSILKSKVERLSLETPSIETILKAQKDKMENQTEFLESSVTGFHFVTGLAVLQKHTPLTEMTLLERKKALFGSDALLS